VVAEHLAVNGDEADQRVRRQRHAEPPDLIVNMIDAAVVTARYWLCWARLSFVRRLGDADRTPGVGVAEASFALCNVVGVRRLEHRAPFDAGRVASLLVGDDEKDVGGFRPNSVPSSSICAPARGPIAA